jgi:cell division inhibitor SepF
MAGVWDRLLGLLGFEEELDEPEAEAAMPLAAQGGGAPVRLREPAAAPRRVRPARAPAWNPSEERAEARTAATPRATVTRLVAGLPGVVVSAPKRFEDAQEAADHLRAGKPVILHADGLDRELTQRLVNFLAGSTYALGGEMHRVGSVVLFAPAGVEVTLPFSLRMSEREER